MFTRLSHRSGNGALLAAPLLFLVWWWPWPLPWQTPATRMLAAICLGSLMLEYFHSAQACVICASTPASEFERHRRALKRAHRGGAWVFVLTIVWMVFEPKYSLIIAPWLYLVLWREVRDRRLHRAIYPHCPWCIHGVPV